MFSTIIIWAAKQLAAYAIAKLAHHLGVDKMAEHVKGELSKYTPLPPDANPSPAAMRKPSASWLDGSDSVTDLSKNNN